MSCLAQGGTDGVSVPHQGLEVRTERVSLWLCLLHVHAQCWGLSMPPYWILRALERSPNYQIQVPSVAESGGRQDGGDGSQPGKDGQHQEPDPSHARGVKTEHLNKMQGGLWNDPPLWCWV